MLVFLLNLFITAFVYLLVPTIYCIIGKPLTKAKIKRIVIINGICTWIIFTFVRSLLDNPGTSASVFLWSFIADRIMTSRLLTEDKNVEKENVEEQNVEEESIVDQSVEPRELTITEPEEQENILDNISQTDNVIMTKKPMFCQKCGGKLTEDGLFCQYCDNKIVGGKSSEIEPEKNELEEESSPDLTANNTFVAKSTTKKKMKFTWLWVLLIIVNCFVAFVSTSESIHGLLFYIEERAIISWRYHNIDPKYAVGYTQEEYMSALRYNAEDIMLFAVLSFVFVLLFIALSLVNCYVCRKKLNIKRKARRILPWLCTLILTVLLCGGIALSYVFEYNDDIVYYSRQVEKEQEEIELKLAEEQKKIETQKLATQLLYSSVEAQTPNEVWEYAQRYPKNALEEFVKIDAYVNIYDSNKYLVDSRYSTDQSILIKYNSVENNNPYLLDNDHVIVSGKIKRIKNYTYSGNDLETRVQEATQNIFYSREYGTSDFDIVIEIYDWIIVD